MRIFKSNMIITKVAILILGYCFYIKTDVYLTVYRKSEIANKIVLMVYPNLKNAENINKYFIAFFIIFGLSIIIDIILLLINLTKGEK